MALKMGIGLDGDLALTVEESQEALNRVASLCHSLGLDVLEGQAKRLLERIENGQTGVAIEVLFEDLRVAVSHKIDDLRIGIVEYKDRALFDDACSHLCGGKLHSDLSIPEEEINLAGQALACGLSTAAVFHAMRSVESSLHSLTQSLGISFPSPVNLQDWKVLTDKIKSEIFKQQNVPGRSQQKTNELAWLSQLMLSADGFRLAWRNHVAHAREKYEDTESRKVLGHVGDYLKSLSEGL